MCRHLLRMVLATISQAFVGPRQRSMMVWASWSRARFRHTAVVYNANV
jgi:hypothetical protein